MASDPPSSPTATSKPCKAVSHVLAIFHIAKLVRHQLSGHVQHPDGDLHHLSAHIHDLQEPEGSVHAEDTTQTGQLGHFGRVDSDVHAGGVHATSQAYRDAK